VNAASKGHLPVVLYLITKQAANPLIRNKWGETAFDAAAAVFEVWICEILQLAEAERWRGTTTPYNPLLVHTTIPLILYENQRLDTRLKTVAVSGGRPKFSASGLGKQGRRSPFELKLVQPDEETGAKVLPAWRSGVQLPLREAPWALPRPATAAHPPMEGVERSHFWLSDWTLDVTHPAVDAEEGWQYAKTFDDPDDKWTAEIPDQLARIMSSNGIVAAGFGGPSARSTSLSSHPQGRVQLAWVRRRRWVRIMRRRLDIPPLAFLEPDGAMYHLDFDGSLIPYTEDASQTQLPDGSDGGREMSTMASTFLSSAQDYVARARYLVGNQLQDPDTEDPNVSAVDVRRAIAKVERATMELRQGILSDDDADRKRQAEVLLNTYSRDLERRRLSAGAQGLLISDLGDGIEEEDNDSDEEFHYPGSGSRETTRPASRSSSSTDYFSRPGTSRVPVDLTPQLTQAPDFRVPTHEMPQKVLSPRWTSPMPHQLHAQWERDDAVSNCRDCQRRFSFLNRRHCRKCGRIFCDRCSSFRAILDPADVVHDPMLPELAAPAANHRVCQSCYDESNNNIPNRLNRTSMMERIVVDQERLTIPGSLTRRQSSSQLSDLADCPVCNQNLDEVGDAQAQEAHVKACLEGSSSTAQPGPPQPAKYLVYRLPAESALLGVECVICLEEFVKGSNVARLSCFCSFHSGNNTACLSSWLQRGKSCPVHAR
ncbi:FYVE-domain-containing protein, partial [Pholiota conissans]